MVKFGEFSPLNPDLQCTGRALVGLGEYEEKRRALLEKKKREYLDQIAQTKAWQFTRPVSGRYALHLPEAATHNIHEEHSNFTSGKQRAHVSEPPAVHKQPDVSSEGRQGAERRADELSLPPLSPGDPCITARDRKLADLRQSFFYVPQSPSNDAALNRRPQDWYQQELRRQIEEKHRLEAERKERARMEEEVIARRLEKQQEQMQRELEREEAQRKVLAEKRAWQVEQVVRRQEELEREAAELRRSKYQFVKQRRRESGPGDVSGRPSLLDAHAGVVPHKEASGTTGLEGAAVVAACREEREGARARAPQRALQQLDAVCGSLEDTLPIPVLRSRSPVVPAAQHEVSLEPAPREEREGARARAPQRALQQLDAVCDSREDTLPIPVLRSRSPVVPAAQHEVSLEPAPREEREGARARAPQRVLQQLDAVCGSLEDTLPIPVLRSHSPVVPAAQHGSSLEPAARNEREGARTRAPQRALQQLDAVCGSLEDTLPIPVLRSCSPVVPAAQHGSSLEPAPRQAPRRYSEGMQVLVSKWQVPAVQKTSVQTTDRFHQVRHNNELMQLGAFRRQLQLEQLRLDELLRRQQSASKT